MPKWGELPPSNPNAEWVKLSSLVGTTFQLKRVVKGVVKGRDSYIFETTEGKLFSVNQVGSSIATQVDRDGIPPLNMNMTVRKEPSTKSPTGYSLFLEPL